MPPSQPQGLPARGRERRGWVRPGPGTVRHGAGAGWAPRATGRGVGPSIAAPPVHDPQLSSSNSRTPLAVLVALLLLRTVLLLIGDGVAYGIARMFTHEATLASVLLYGNVAVVAVDIITLAVVVIVLRREATMLRSLIGRFRFGDIGWGLLLFVIGMLGFLIATYIGNLVMYRGPPPTDAGAGVAVPPWLALWSIVVLPITVALAEETLYRGYLQPRLTMRCGLWVGLLVPALLFGLQHVAFSLTTPQAAASRVITMALVGVLLGAFYLWRQRLGQLIIAHWLIDVVGLLLRNAVGEVSWRMLLGLIPVPAVLFIAWAAVRYSREADEFARRQLTESLAIGFWGGSALVAGYGLMDSFGAPTLSWLWAFATYMLCWAAGAAIVGFRYHS